LSTQIFTLDLVLRLLLDHTINVIRALPITASEECVPAAVFHDIGKALTRTFDEGKGVYHLYRHDAESARLFVGICERYQWSTEDLLM
jgi:hypothetical protein